MQHIEIVWFRTTIDDRREGAAAVIIYSQLIQ